jgi:hypothetical protein
LTTTQFSIYASDFSPPASLLFFLLIQSLNPAKVFAAKRNPAEIKEQKTVSKALEKA